MAYMVLYSTHLILFRHGALDYSNLKQRKQGKGDLSSGRGGGPGMEI